MRTADEMWREAGDVRASLSDAIDVTNDSSASILHVLRNLYRTIILTDLDYALDKKVEQELWNVCFKVPISGMQPAKGRKSSNPLLNWFLEGAAGFYLVLLQEICSQCDNDLDLCKKNSQLGIFNGPSYSIKPKKASFLYICQHCLIHLGDSARYRMMMNDAEGYYKQAARVEPSSGHPYNQLALLESARDGLSTLYYYVRSLALKHPFPPAKTNLDILLKKQLAQKPPYHRAGRLTPEEFTSFFLKLQGQIGLGCELDQAEQTLPLLNLTLPSLVATEAVSAHQLIKMLVITLYTADECSSSLATDAQKRSLQLAVELAASILNSCLTACCSTDQLTEYLAVIKLVFDWFYLKPEVIDRVKRGQLWSSAAKLLNQLHPDEDDDGLPLPEDLDLLEFTPLRQKWPSTQLTRYPEHQIRCYRILQRGKWLAARENSYLSFENDEFTSLEPKEIKILTRPRNVALSAILKQNSDPLPPLPPVKPTTYPRPALPPRLERIKAEQGLYSSFGAALPDLSMPPPPVPPPGLGFPPPPAAWSMPAPPPPTSYQLFNSPWQLPSFPEPMQQLGPASLWSGPGPSPLERLLEQQKAMRSSPAKK